MQRKDPKVRLETLVGLAPHLPKNLLIDTLNMVIEIKDLKDGTIHDDPSYYRRSDMIKRLAPWIVKRLASDTNSIMQKFLRKLASHSRKDTYSEIAAVAPVISAIGGKKALLQTNEAMKDVARWWP